MLSGRLRKGTTLEDRGDSATAQLKIRVKERTRAELEQAAKVNDWPLNREIATRLETSLEHERRAPTRETGVLLNAVSTMIAVIEANTGNRWHEDGFTFLAVKRAIDDLFEANSPLALQGLPADYFQNLIRQNDEVERIREARDIGRQAVAQFEEEHPELNAHWDPHHSPEIVRKREGLMGRGGVVPSEASTEVEKQWMALIEAAKSGDRAIIDAQASHRAADDPFAHLQEEHLDLARRVAERFIPAFRIIPTKG